MKIEKNKVVSIHYTLTLQDGVVADSSEGMEPLEYLHGYENLIPGLEKELEGKVAGDKLSVTVAPGEAYGLRSEELVVEVDRNQFPEDVEIEEGMQPLILSLHRRFHTEFRSCFSSAKPYIEQMLALILCRIAFHQTNMRTHFITIVAEINKFTNLIIRMRFVGGKNSNDGVGAHAIKSISITGDNTF